MPLSADLLADDGRRLLHVGQQLVVGVGYHQHVAGAELPRHLLRCAADAQRAGGRLVADAGAVDQRAAHLLDADHVGGAGHAHGYAGGDHHQIAVLDKPRLLRCVNGGMHQLVGAVRPLHHDGDKTPVQRHLAADLGIQQQRHHRGLRTEPADHLGGDAPLTDGEDGVGADVRRRGAGGVGGGSRHGQMSAGGRHRPAGAVDVALGLAGDGVHGLYRLHRVLARRRLAGEHNGAGAVVNGVGHVGDLGTGGPGIFDHGVQHLGGGDDRLAAGHALGDHILLNGGDLRKVDLHAHVAASHHDAVRFGQDLPQVADALLIFDLGDDADAGVGGVQHAADLPDIGGAADKAGGDEVEALLHAEQDIVLVLLAHVGHGQGHAGYVDALVILHDAAVLHPAADGLGRRLQHRQPHQSVIQQDGVPGVHILRQLGVGDGTARLVALHILNGQGEGLPGGQLHRAVFEVAQPHLRPLGVQHGRHRQIQLLPQRLDGVQPYLMLRVGAVGEIEPGHVHAREHHLPQHALLVGGGAQCTNDLRFSHIMNSFSTRKSVCFA